MIKRKQAHGKYPCACFQNALQLLIKKQNLPIRKFEIGVDQPICSTSDARRHIVRSLNETWKKFFQNSICLRIPFLDFIKLGLIVFKVYYTSSYLREIFRPFPKCNSFFFKKLIICLSCFLNLPVIHNFHPPVLSIAKLILHIYYTIIYIIFQIKELYHDFR